LKISLLTEQKPVIFEHEVIRNDGEPNPKIWHYIVPGGLDVIFKDEDGNELTRYHCLLKLLGVNWIQIRICHRIRNMGEKSAKRRIIPILPHDL